MGDQRLAPHQLAFSGTSGNSRRLVQIAFGVAHLCKDDLLVKCLPVENLAPEIRFRTLTLCLPSIRLGDR